MEELLRAAIEDVSKRTPKGERMGDIELVRDTQPRELTVADVQNQVAKIQELMKEVLKPDLHYGVIPGTEKPTLLKPGAEKIAFLFRFGTGELQVVTKDLGNGHREITIKTPIVHLPTGQTVSFGVGSCSTMESKYRYRNQKRLCPACGHEAIIKGKDEYGGGWLCWKKQGGCGAKFADNDERVAGQMVGKIENEDIADVYNTVLKMAAKRSYIDGTIKASAASDFFTQDLESEESTGEEGFDKGEWQRKHRNNFKEEHGYSETAHYGAGGLRESVLKRDGFACVLCGMTDEQHKQKWDRPITVDHVDRDRANNTMDNLQTLCLSCHGAKDQKPELREPQVPEFKDTIIQKKKEGATYQAIADELGFSIASIWKWYNRWVTPSRDDSTPTGKPAHTLGDRLTTLIMSPKLTEGEREEIRKDYRGKCTTEKQRREFLDGWERDVSERGSDPSKALDAEGKQQEIPY